MLQVQTVPQKVSILSTQLSTHSAHLSESRTCVSPSVLEAHVQAIRRHARLLAAGVRKA